LFSGAEMAGIKFHAAIDVEISHNHIYRTCRGLWLDWMAQGTRVSANLFHENQAEDLFVEVDHGPFLVDNNLFLSPTTLLDVSEGGAYAHNLIAGRIASGPELHRATPFHKPHSTELAGLRNIVGGDDRFYNNIFVGCNGLAAYDAARLPCRMEGNVFYKGVKPSKLEKGAVVLEFDPHLKLVPKADGYWLEVCQHVGFASARGRKLVTTDLLGKAATPNLPYEQPDGAPLRLDKDYFGKPRDEANPAAGPFENPGSGPLTLKVW